MSPRRRKIDWEVIFFIVVVLGFFMMVGVFIGRANPDADACIEMIKQSANNW